MMGINIASLLLKQTGSGPRDLIDSKAGNGSFESMLDKSFQAGIEKMKFTQNRHSQKSEKTNPKDFNTYLDALRSKLLSKGKPFDDIYIKRDDAYVLKGLLNECGYGNDRMDQMIGRLLDNSPMGEIKLSQFFAQIKEMGPPEKKKTDAITLDVSMVPYIQSILKDFDLSPDEIGKVLNNGRSAEGGLSLQKLIEDLEIVGRKAMKESRGIVNLDEFPQMKKNLEGMGFQIPAGKQSGRVSMEDFIHSLKQIATTLSDVNHDPGDQAMARLNVDDIKGLKIRLSGSQNPSMAVTQKETAVSGDGFGQPDNDKGLPKAVTHAVDRVMEKVVTSDKTDDSLTAIIKNSKIKFDDPESKKIDMARPLENNKQVDAFGKADTALSFKGEGKPTTGAQVLGNMASMSDMRGDKGINDPIEIKTQPGKATATVFHMTEDMVHQREPESAPSLSQKPNNSGNVLPNYLVDQLGKQISRSLIRGDGVVRFQLKPSDLGFVKLEMHMTDNQVNISVAAENSTVKELLLSNIQELREMLSGQGIKLDKIDVHVGSDFNQTFSDLREGAEKDNGSNQGQSRKSALLPEEDNQKGFFESRHSAGQDSVVDLVA
jgi:Flagellar hook-length control protein FliK